MFLRQQREAHGLTQQEFARRGGMAGASVRAYESGRRVPTLAAIEALLAGVGRQLKCTATPLRSRAAPAPQQVEDDRLGGEATG